MERVLRPAVDAPAATEKAEAPVTVSTISYAMPSGPYVLSFLAGVLGFVLGRTPVRRLLKEAPRAIPTALQVAQAAAALDRYLKERRGKKAA